MSYSERQWGREKGALWLTETEREWEKERRKDKWKQIQLEANPQILEDFWDNASFSLGWLIYDQQELGHTGAEHMRQLCGLELLGAMAGSSQENRIVSRSKDGGMAALMGTHDMEDLEAFELPSLLIGSHTKSFYSKDLPPSLFSSLPPFLSLFFPPSLLPPAPFLPWWFIVHLECTRPPEMQRLNKTWFLTLKDLSVV